MNSLPIKKGLVIFIFVSMVISCIPFLSSNAVAVANVDFYNPVPENNSVGVNITLDAWGCTVDSDEAIDVYIDVYNNETDSLFDSSNESMSSFPAVTSISFDENLPVYTEMKVEVTYPGEAGVPGHTELFYFTTIDVDSPVIQNPDPVNNSEGVSYQLSNWSCETYSNYGSQMDANVTVYDESDNQIVYDSFNAGEWDHENISVTFDSNLDFEMEYRIEVYVQEVEDYNLSNNEIFYFTTGEAPPPDFYDPDPTNNSENILLTLNKWKCTVDSEESITAVISVYINETDSMFDSSNTLVIDFPSNISVDFDENLPSDTRMRVEVGVSGDTGQVEYLETFYFTTVDPPEIYNPDPANNSEDINYELSYWNCSVNSNYNSSMDANVTVYDETDNQIVYEEFNAGEWDYENVSVTFDSDLDFNEKYRVEVYVQEVEDYNLTNNETFYFTTEESTFHPTVENFTVEWVSTNYTSSYNVSFYLFHPNDNETLSYTLWVHHDNEQTVETVFGGLTANQYVEWSLTDLEMYPGWEYSFTVNVTDGTYNTDSTETVFQPIFINGSSPGGLQSTHPDGPKYDSFEWYPNPNYWTHDDFGEYPGVVIWVSTLNPDNRTTYDFELTLKYASNDTVVRKTTGIHIGGYYYNHHLEFSLEPETEYIITLNATSQSDSTKSENATWHFTTDRLPFEGGGGNVLDMSIPLLIVFIIPLLLNLYLGKIGWLGGWAMSGLMFWMWQGTSGFWVMIFILMICGVYIYRGWTE